MSHKADAKKAAGGAEKETARLEAFSDGVFAFAITLLALELKVPHAEERHGEATIDWLWAALCAQWPSYLTFAASFITILIMWTHHQALFRLVHRNTLTLQFANGLLLLLTTTVAFPTAVVAEYGLTPAAPVAAMLYVGQQFLLASAFYLLLRVVLGPAVVSPHAPAELIRTFKKNYALGPPLYAGTFAIAYYSPKLAMALSLVLWVFWALMPS